MISFYLSAVETDEQRGKVLYIYENFHSFMCYTAGQVLEGRSHDVEDAVHDAMLKIIDNIDLIDLSDEKRAKNLCGIIARNKAKDRSRAKSNSEVSFEDVMYEEGDVGSVPDEILITKETYKAIVKALRSLDDKYKDVCMMKYLHQMKEREIAKILDLPQRTVSTRIFRGKQLLREALRKESLYV